MRAQITAVLKEWAAAATLVLPFIAVVMAGVGPSDASILQLAIGTLLISVGSGALIIAIANALNYLKPGEPAPDEPLYAERLDVPVGQRVDEPDDQDEPAQPVNPTAPHLVDEEPPQAPAAEEIEDEELSDLL